MIVSPFQKDMVPYRLCLTKMRSNSGLLDTLLGTIKKNIFRGEVDFTVLFSYTTFTSSLQNRSLVLVDRHAERNSPLFKIKT